jgi:hypothetical protein
MPSRPSLRAADFQNRKERASNVAGGSPAGASEFHAPYSMRSVSSANREPILSSPERGLELIEEYQGFPMWRKDASEGL